MTPKLRKKKVFERWVAGPHSYKSLIHDMIIMRTYSKKLSYTKEFKIRITVEKI